jgi:hypothetical protein
MKTAETATLTSRRSQTTIEIAERVAAWATRPERCRQCRRREAHHLSRGIPMCNECRGDTDALEMLNGLEAINRRAARGIAIGRLGRRP